MDTSGKNLVDYIAQITAMESHLEEIIRWEVGTYLHNPGTHKIDSLDGLDKDLKEIKRRLKDAKQGAELQLYGNY